MPVFDIKLDNAKKIDAALSNLEKKVAKTAVRRGVRAGRKPTLAAARSNAKNMVGGQMGQKLSKNIVLRTTKRSALRVRDGYAMEVRLKSSGEGAPAEFVHVSAAGTRTYVPHAIEYGHVAHGQSGSGAKVAAPVPFLRNAHEQTEKQSLEIAEREIVNEIQKAWSGS